MENKFAKESIVQHARTTVIKIILCRALDLDNSILQLQFILAVTWLKFDLILAATATDFVLFFFFFSSN